MVGLARSPAAQQIMSKLPIFTNNELQQLVREPVLQDKRAEHVKFQQHAFELLKRVSGPGDQTKNLQETELSLEMLHRASVVAQTKITFPKKQLLQLIRVRTYFLLISYKNCDNRAFENLVFSQE